MGGVTIGDGAVIGSGAVVTKDIPPYAIAVGIPAKVIRYRFSDEEIKFLLNIRYWDWSDDMLCKSAPFFGNIEALQQFCEINKFISEDNVL
jgi:tetrahydrodipicolinate N-succinyltransferase